MNCKNHPNKRAMYVKKKVCRICYNRLPEVREQRRKFYQIHREEIRAYSKNYYQQIIGCEKEKTQQLKQMKPEEVLEKLRYYED